MFKDHSADLNAQLADALSTALSAMGEIAARHTREVMQHHYGAPVVDTGALMQDVDWSVDAREMRIGNTLPYAAPVHDGTLRTPGRPYLTDGLAAAVSDMAEACGQTLAQRMGA